MQHARWPAVLALVAATVYLCSTLPSTFAFDRPLLSATTCLLTLGYSVGAAGTLLAQDGQRVQQDRQQGPRFSWHIAREIRALRQPHTTARKFRLAVLLLAAIVALRVQLLVAVLRNVQCAGPTLQPFLPVALAALDTWTIRRRSLHIILPQSNRKTQGNEHDRLPLQNKRLLCTLLLSLGSFTTLATYRSPVSTYVCPVVLSPLRLIPFLQLAGAAADLVILNLISWLLREDDTRNSSLSGAIRFEAVGGACNYAALLCGLVLLIENIVYYSVFASDSERFFILPRLYLWSILKLNVALCFTALSVILLLSQVDATTVVLIPTFVATCIISMSFAWNASLNYSARNSPFGLIAFCCAAVSFGMYFHFEAYVQEGASHLRPLLRRKSAWLYLVLFMICLIQCGLWTTHSSNIVDSHPIDSLLHDAQATHEAYVDQASTSKTLSEAVKTYRHRYGRAPPPAFDQWYAYATSRNSVIIDDFDSIHRDLGPFHALSPRQIREDTWRIISNPWHDVSGLMIRNGAVTIAPNVMPTHRWMLEGVIHLVNPFAQWLPDMDLALNVNDEPRVTQPHHTSHRRDHYEPGDALRSTNAFSDSRAEQWMPVTEEGLTEPLMLLGSVQRTFYDFGNQACPPSSRARNERVWDLSRLCESCTKLHSIGPFLANWTSAADVCTQPDLADLHGLYISPASFKPSYELYPIFSQSKAHGFSDILYPSAWNYMQKTKYAPNDDFPDVPFSNKNNTIFWRGGTTEGISHDFGHWQGMARQRFVHLASPRHTGSQTILMPITNPTSPTKYKYTSLSSSTLKNLMSTDMSFVEEILRCRGLDCVQQEHEYYPLSTHSDFQLNWQYKYLLDMDGAGFSGRFLAFLSSRSLPFKTALYREWWDDRVTAWKHFVPLDLRGHGFWATLAYFAGMRGTWGKLVVEVEGHEEEGEGIAEGGREWAGRVLRKEDMEIYMFRLLLEWGRLTDDRRDEIGFEIGST